MKAFLKTSAKVIFVLITVSFASCTHSNLKKTDTGRTIYSNDMNMKEITALEGKVKDKKTGKPIEGAVIEMKNAARGVGYYKTETDSNGEYKISDFISNINYEISVSAPGYVTYSKVAQITPSKNNIVLARESILTGKVRNSRGRLMPGVEVMLKKYGGAYNAESSKPLFTKTDSSGEYSFKKLATGSYFVKFSAPNYIEETANLQKLREGETFRLSMEMYKPSSISGTVKIKGLKAPAVDINVTAKGRHTYSNVSYDDGTFKLQGLKPGKYKIFLSHQGFDTVVKQLTLGEGSDRTMETIMVNPKKPKVQIHSYRYTFTPGSSLQFNFKSLRMETVDVAIYKVPLKYMTSKNKDPESENIKKAGFKKITFWRESVKKFKPFRWMYYAVNINKSLPPGGYCIEAKGKGGALARKFFTVTNTGVVMKRSPKRIYAYVTNLVKNTPIKNAQIIVYKYSKYKYKGGKKIKQSRNPQTIEDLPIKVVKRGKTNARGMFTAPLKLNDSLSLLVISPDGSYAICNAGNAGYYNSEREKFYIYTERPIYRAGDTVHFKIIAKSGAKKFLPIKGRTIYVQARRGSNRILLNRTMELDDWGTAQGSFTIPKGITLGYGAIQAGFKKNNLYGYQYFKVEQYRKPEFKTEIIPGKKFYINGETAEFKVESKYFFGSPLKDAIVRYRFYERRLSHSSRYRSRNRYSKIKLQGEKYTDGNGSVILKIDSGILPYDREITLETTVTDRSNISITSRKTIKIGRGEFYISMKPEKNFFDSMEKKKVTIITRDHSGKPVSTKVKLKLHRYIWKPIQMVYVHDSRPHFTTTVTTAKNGTGTVFLPKDFNSSGEFDLIAEARDRMNNEIKSSAILWIYHGLGDDIASRFKNLEVTAETNLLKKPGTVTFLVKSRFKDSFVWLTLEGRDVYESRVIKMNKNIVPVKFKIKGSYAPNLYVRGVMQRKRALYSASNPITIPGKDIKMKVKITPSKKKYGPGERVYLKVKTTDERGRALKADLSLAAVDESIFSIAKDNTPPIREHFYSKISNWVMTSYSYPITLLAGASKDGTKDVRSEFKDTAFWVGNIRTMENGTANVSFRLPDNLTTWRLTAIGHDKEGRMGDTREKIVTTRDLIARIGKPRFMVEEDEIELLGIVNNNTNEGISNIKTEFSANGKKLKAKRDYKMTLPEYGSGDKKYNLVVPSGINKMELFFKAQAAKREDSVLHILPVEKRGVAYTISGSGDNSYRKKIELRGLKDTSDFPYSCVEQTISRFLPAMAMGELLAQGNYSSMIKKESLGKFKKELNGAIDRIENTQNYDGTWGWWNGGRGNADLTCYAMDFLTRAKKAGYGITSYKLERGKRALVKMAKSGNLGDRELSNVLKHLPALGEWNHEAFKRLSWKKNMGSYIAANLYAAAHNGMKYLSLTRLQQKEAREVKVKMKSLLAQRTKSDAEGIYWETEDDKYDPWTGGKIGVTSTVLSAISVNKDMAGLASRAALSLSRRFDGTAWRSTRETARSVLALSKYLKGKELGFTPRGNLQFKLNRRDVAEINFDIEKHPDTISLTRAVKLMGMNSTKDFKLEMSGDAPKDLIYTAKLKGTLKFQPGGLFSFMKSEKRGIKSISNGIAARRDIYYLSRVKDMKSREYLVPSSLSERNRIEVGDEMLVTIKFKAQDDFSYVMLQDFLPSGFEVVKKDIYSTYKPYIHVERRDNRMIYFFSSLKKGKEYEIAYVMRAELPGKFIMRSSRAVPFGFFQVRGQHNRGNNSHQNTL